MTYAAWDALLVLGDAGTAHAPVDPMTGVPAPTWTDQLDRALPSLAAAGAALAAVLFGIRLVRGPRGRRDSGRRRRTARHWRRSP